MKLSKFTICLIIVLGLSACGDKPKYSFLNIEKGTVARTNSESGEVCFVFTFYDDNEENDYSCMNIDKPEPVQTQLSKPNPQPVTIVTSLDGIKLGMTWDDVRFEKGEPDGKYANPDAGGYLNDAPFYGTQEKPTVVNIKDGVVTGVYSNHLTPQITGMRTQNLRSYGSSSLISQFGEPTSIVKHEGTLTRTYHFSKYNLEFQLTQNKINWIGLESKSN